MYDMMLLAFKTDSTRVAVLAYSSILPQAYWAEERRAGCAPMRAHTVYEQVELDQPGTPARIHTYAHREDLSAMEADIREEGGRLSGSAAHVVGGLESGLLLLPVGERVFLVDAAGSVLWSGSGPFTDTSAASLHAA